MNGLRRALALFLCFVLCFSLLPLSAFAEGPEDEEEQIEELLEPEDLETPEEGEDLEEEDEACEHVPAEAVTENVLAPSCTEPGSHDEVVYCSLCGEELSRETVEDPALGHTPIDVEGVPAQIGVPGTKAGQKCAVCGKVLSGFEEIEALTELEPEPDPEEKDERVRVEFVCEPKETQITVYVAARDNEDALVPALDENEEPAVIRPEEDGAYLLLPGAYLYDAACKGYTSVEKAELTVREPTGDEAAQTVELTLQDTQKTMLLDAPRGTGVIDAGFCGNPSVNGGEDVTWVLYTDGLFTISGAGKMTDYSSSRDVPWKNYRSSILSLSIADGILSVGDYAFGSCTALAEISLPTSVKSIGKGAFGGCTALTDEKFSIPTGVESISNFAFGGCNGLTSIVIPDGVKSIDEGAFAESSGLTSVVIPASATSFGGNPFWGCEGLKTVGPIGSGCNIEFGWEEEIPDSAFSISSSDFCTQESILLPATLKRIGSGAFWNCGTLSELAIPGGVTSIGSGAFCGCHNIESLTIPSGVTVLEEDTFRNCTSMENIWILGDVTSIGDNAFLNCTALKKVQLPQSVESIGESAFGNCYELESIKIPTSVESIGDDAFNTCTSLKKIRLPNNVTSIGQRAFLGCTSLKSAVLPLYLERIERDLFFACADLEWVYIPKNVTSIGGFAFNGCDALTTVYYEGTDTQWGILENNIEVVPYNGGTRDTSKTWLLSRNIVCNSSVPPEDDDCVYIVSTGDDPWTIDMEGSFESIVAETSSTQYNPKLAYCLAGLSRAVYKERDIRESMESLGFDYANAETMFKDDADHTLSGYAIAKKTLSGGKTLVLIVIRGSVGYNWNNLLNIGTAAWDGNGQFQALLSDTIVVYDTLKELLGGSIPNTDDTIYVITGHSQGAGAANVLTEKLINVDNVPISHIYDYNFACPNVGSYTDERIWDLGGRYDCIFNIGNIEDPVTLLPNKELLTVVYELFENYLGQLYKSPPNPDATWWKYGNSYWFVPHEGNRAGSDEAWAGHDMLFYLRHLSNQYPLKYYYTYSQIEEYKPNLWWKLFATLCPVDMVVYGKDGKPIAGVTNDQANCYDPNSTVMIFTAGDRKCIFLPADQEYDVRMTGTDSGEMTFRIMDVNLADGEVLAEKDFISVPLTLGKVMTSSVGGETSVKAARLLVLDEQENPIREVKEDGTEILYLADPAKKPTSLTMDREYLALKQTDTTQELSVTNLPEKWLPYLEWSSDNTSVVKVTKTGEGKGKLTPDPEEKGAVGTAWITASVDTGEGVLSARCRVDVVAAVSDPVSENPGPHFAPNKLTDVRLLDTKATVELYRADYTRINVIPVLAQNQQYAQAFTDVLTPDGSADDNNGAAVESAVFVENKTNTGINGLFTLRVVDDHTLEIVPKEKALNDPKAVKGSYKAALLVIADGREFTTAPLALTVKKTQPKITVKVDKLNSFIPGDTKPIVFSGAAVKSAKLDPEKEALQPDWLTYDEKAFTVTLKKNALDLNRSGKLYLLVQPEGWNVKLPVTVSVSAAKSAPKLTLKPNTLSLHPGVNDYAHAAVTVTPAGFNDPKVWTLAVVSVLEGKNDASGALELSVIGNEITARKGAEPPEDDKAHTYKATLALMRRDGDGSFAETPVRTTLTVKLLAPSANITLTAKASGTIDLAVPGSPVTIVPTLKNYSGAASCRITKIVDAAGNKVPEDVFRIDGLQITASNAKQGKYSARLTAELGGKTLTVDVPFTVKQSSKAPAASVTLKAAGFIDVIRPGTAVTLTPTVKNFYGWTLGEEDLTIRKTYDAETKKACDLDASGLFEIEAAENAYILTAKPGAELSHLDKFTATATVGGIASKAVSLTVKMGAAKIAQSVKAVTMLADDCYDRAVVRLTTADPTLSDIDHVELVPPTDKLKRKVFALTPLGNGEYAIGYNDSLLPVNFKSGTVKLNVFLKGNRTQTPNATLSVSVKLG